MASTRDIVPGFAARLKAARLAAGLTQRELALRAGVGELTIVRMETEQRSPSLRVAAEVAEQLGTGLDSLVWETPKKLSKKPS